MEEFKKGKSYQYSYIMEIISNVSYFYEELGTEIIGENFLIFRIGTTTVSFMLDGTIGDKFSYECIYNQ